MDEDCLRSIQESKTLAGIFQSVVEDCKVRKTKLLKKFQNLKVLRKPHIFIGSRCISLFLQSLHPSIDDFIGKSRKLENQIRSTIFAFSAFLESFQNIAIKASNTKGKPYTKHAKLINANKLQDPAEILELAS